MRKIWDFDYKNAERKAGIVISENAERISIDNVAEYYFLHVDQFSHQRFSEVAANIAPPFQEMFLHFRSPSRFATKQDGVKPLNALTGIESVGIHIHADVIQPEDSKQFPDNAKWQVVITYFILWDGVPFPMSTEMMHVECNGQPCKQSNEIAHSAYTAAVYYPKVFDGNPDILDYIYTTRLVFRDIAGLALTFMHCKNVEIRQEQVDAKLAKRTHERHGYRPRTYKTLDIIPMKHVLRSAQSCGGVSVPQALHICRGHFKDYRQRGLFGKTKGIYWWSDNVRGDRQYGEIEKDYSIHAPVEQ